MTKEKASPRINLTLMFNSNSQALIKTGPALFSVTLPVDAIVKLTSAKGGGTNVLTRDGETNLVKETKSEIKKRIAAAKKL